MTDIVWLTNQGFAHDICSIHFQRKKYNLIIVIIFIYFREDIEINSKLLQTFKVSRNAIMRLQCDMLPNILSLILTFLQSIVCLCIMIRHYIRRQLILKSDIMYRFLRISGIKV